MSNTTISAKRPAIQIAGSLTDGITFQNLSANSPVYVGYDPSVNGLSFSGYLAAGGSYTTPKGKDVWLYADLDTPIVYDYSTGASPGASSSVTVTSGQLTVSQASIVLGTWNLNALPASTTAYFGIANYNAGGDSFGDITPRLSNASRVLASSTYQGSTTYSLDCSNLQTLHLNCVTATRTGSSGLYKIKLIWKNVAGVNGAQIATDTFLVFDYLDAFVNIKSDICDVQIITDQYMPTLGYGLFFAGSSRLLTERTVTTRNLTQMQTGNGSSNIQSANSDDGPVRATVSTTAQTGFARMSLPTCKGRNRTVLAGPSSMSVGIRAGVFNQVYDNWRDLYYSVMNGTPIAYDVLAGRAPYFLDCYQPGTSTGSIEIESLMVDL